jgi:hypothetical protein
LAVLLTILISAIVAATMLALTAGQALRCWPAQSAFGSATRSPTRS